MSTLCRFWNFLQPITCKQKYLISLQFSKLCWIDRITIREIFALEIFIKPWELSLPLNLTTLLRTVDKVDFSVQRCFCNFHHPQVVLKMSLFKISGWKLCLKSIWIKKTSIFIQKYIPNSFIRPFNYNIVFFLFIFKKVQNPKTANYKFLYGAFHIAKRKIRSKRNLNFNIK